MSSSHANMPYIKSEPEDFGNNPNRYLQNSHYGHSQSYANYPGHQEASIDPSQLSMPNGNYGNMQFGGTFGSHQNAASSFNMGNSGFAEDELLESLDFGNNASTMMDEYTNINQKSQPRTSTGMAVSHQGQIYSSTPDGPPIQSPFLAGFDYSQFRPLNSIPQHMSPLQNAQFMAGKRPSIQAQHRKSSDQRSPLTPRTAAMAGLHIGTTPDSGGYTNGRPIRTPSLQASRHQKTLSGQLYDSTPGSLQSYLDSPLSSPTNALHHASISETMGGKHGSLPNKVENGHTPNQETVEAKKRRRRASHNAVERRRRDNINERIQDLSHLVPQHRLDDDRVKKQLATNGPMSPAMGATSMSPPNTVGTATSLLAGSSGRRAASTAGNITLGLPIEDKEKGPNKGDILNGSVSWTRDLMWALYRKYQQEEELAQYMMSIGGHWPFQTTDDERRMRSELMEAMEKNDPTSFDYSRPDGSGLRVPKHTNVAGDKLIGNAEVSPQSNFELSPGFHSGGSGTNSGSNGAGQPQFWHSAGHTGISFKEEDEFMEMT